MSNLCQHGKVVCVCGVVLAQCRCMESYKNIIVSGKPCTHKKCRRCSQRPPEKGSNYCKECNDDQAVREGFLTY